MPAPIGNTCPDIHSCQRKIRNLRSEYKSQLEDSYYFEQDLENIIDSLEELRTCNSKLRDWGETTEERLSEQEQYANSLEDDKTELEYQLVTVKKQLEEVQTNWGYRFSLHINRFILKPIYAVCKSTTKTRDKLAHRKQV